MDRDEEKDKPRRWKHAYKLSPCGFFYGCYFPGTDLNVNSMGGRGTGAPKGPEITWIDPPPEHLKSQ